MIGQTITPDDPDCRKLTLPADSEFRFEVSFDESVEISLLEGRAEIFGAELPLQKLYRYSGCKLALFSYHGCKINIKGTTLSEYISDETPMHSYLNLHFALENLRNNAQLKSLVGPRILFLGNGRTSVSSILVNYAVKSRRKPVFADIDINNGSLLFPGNISAHLMDRMFEPSEKFTYAYPISYFYGHSGGYSTGTSSSSNLPLENPKLYIALLERLAHVVKSKLSQDKECNSSGLLMTGFAWSDSPLFFDLLEQTINIFSISSLVIVGNERLHSDLSKRLTHLSDTLTVLKLSKSGGIVAKDSTFRRLQMMKNIKAYFYGFQGEYAPFPVAVPFRDLHIRRIGEGPVAPSSALPLGASRKVDEARIVKVELITTSSPANAPNTVYIQAKSLLNSVLAISQAAAGDEEGLIERPIAGYVLVTAVDESKGRITLLSPSPGRIPFPYLILGTIKYIE